jgi:hypothetical protein
MQQYLRGESIALLQEIRFDLFQAMLTLRKGRDYHIERPRSRVGNALAAEHRGSGYERDVLGDEIRDRGYDNEAEGEGIVWARCYSIPSSWNLR